MIFFVVQDMALLLVVAVSEPPTNDSSGRNGDTMVVIDDSDSGSNGIESEIKDDRRVQEGKKSQCESPLRKMILHQMNKQPKR